MIKDLAVKVAALEGGKKNLSIAQITEVIGHIRDLLWQDQETHGPGEGPLYKALIKPRKKTKKVKKKG